MLRRQCNNCPLISEGLRIKMETKGISNDESESSAWRGKERDDNDNGGTKHFKTDALKVRVNFLLVCTYKETSDNGV